MVTYVRPTAHPRVGGENATPAKLRVFLNGSSPRGRGKLRRPEKRGRGPGLIPAWAGKTDLDEPETVQDWAHPRVGGENGALPADGMELDGSSPRGRGKPVETIGEILDAGLIPAWAGKTLRSRRLEKLAAAHPRVGGENSQTRASPSTASGSSPRGRGKHFLTCAFIKRIGQILETLELAVSSGSYSLCDVYATDAPQDQARNTGLALPSSRASS